MSETQYYKKPILSMAVATAIMFALRARRADVDARLEYMDCGSARDYFLAEKQSCDTAIDAIELAEWVPA